MYICYGINFFLFSAISSGPLTRTTENQIKICRENKREREKERERRRQKKNCNYPTFRDFDVTVLYYIPFCCGCYFCCLKPAFCYFISFPFKKCIEMLLLFFCCMKRLDSLVVIQLQALAFL